MVIHDNAIPSIATSPKGSSHFEGTKTIFILFLLTNSSISDVSLWNIKLENFCLFNELIHFLFSIFSLPHI